MHKMENRARVRAYEVRRRAGWGLGGAAHRAPRSALHCMARIKGAGGTRTCGRAVRAARGACACVAGGCLAPALPPLRHRPCVTALRHRHRPCLTFYLARRCWS